MQMQAIELHSDAPQKPASDRPCNGCGVCCAAEPCPVARAFLFQFRGSCRALEWREEEARYMCGMAEAPERYSPLIPALLGRKAAAFITTRIAAGTGCDCGLEVSETSSEAG